MMDMAQDVIEVVNNAYQTDITKNTSHLDGIHVMGFSMGDMIAQ